MHLQLMHLPLMHSHPKLLVVGATPPVAKPSLGGNERYLVNLLELARSMGLETFYISDGGAGYEALFEQTAAAGAERRSAPFCTDPAKAAAALDAAIDEIRPTMLHVNGHSGWLEPVIVRSRRLASVKRRVYTMHLPPPSLHAQSARPFGWKDRIPGRWTARQSGVDRRFLACFDDVLTVSRFFGELAVKLGYLRDDQVSFVPNGVDAELFHPRQTARVPGPLRIGSACRLTEIKRVDLLVEAFARLDPAAPAELHIAGDGPEEPNLRAQAARLGVGDRVRFHGFRADVPDFLGEMDVFAISSDEEAAPYSQLEAMACGLPAAVTAVGDLPYMVRDGVDGFVSAAGDAAGLAARLQRLVADSELRDRMSVSARERAAAEFSSEVWRDRMWKFLEQRLGLRTT